MPDFLAELPVVDFDWALADFDAEDFLAPLPFFAFSGGLPPLGAGAAPPPIDGAETAVAVLTCMETPKLAVV